MEKIDLEIDDFINYCDYKGLSKKTYGSYEQSLRLLVIYLKEKFNITKTEQVKEKHLKDYIENLKERGKYTVVYNEKSKKINNPQNRGDFGKKVSIVKAPTGFGKTFGYVNEALSNDNRSKLVVAPTNDLKDEIYSEIVKKFGMNNVMKTPILEKLKDDEMQEVIDRFDKMGLFPTKKKYLNKKMKELEGKRDKGIISETEEIDLSNIRNYIQKNKEINNFEGHVVSTHERLFYFSEKFFRNL